MSTNDAKNRPKKRPISKAASPSKQRIDRRVGHTREALGDALVELIQEKPFKGITVQDVLDRARISRSTFYLHYRDKNDLFLSDVEEFFESIATMLSRRGDQLDRVAPVRELFAHLAEMRRFHAALVASGKMHDVLALAQGHFARGIEQRLTELARAREITSERRTAIAQVLAGGLLSLLSWWIDRGKRASPEQMDHMYHQMVWTGVNPSLNDR
ncbi:MAG TPA: TetR/AcrR family transcriptional regulator [Myxococcaceae bacterium]|nr:TetR/AcrR family transcriptional regulator [Myxococcaceae bacterium]